MSVHLCEINSIIFNILVVLSLGVYNPSLLIAQVIYGYTLYRILLSRKIHWAWTSHTTEVIIYPMQQS